MGLSHDPGFLRPLVGFGGHLLSCVFHLGLNLLSCLTQLTLTEGSKVSLIHDFQLHCINGRHRQEIDTG